MPPRCKRISTSLKKRFPKPDGVLPSSQALGLPMPPPLEPESPKAESKATGPITQTISAVQMKLSVQPGKQSNTVSVNEDTVQRAIMLQARQDGYIVLSTSEHRKSEPCPHCHKKMTSRVGRGTDKGVPDLLLTHETRWPPGLWCGIEVKGPKTPVSPEQKILHGQQRIFIARSVADYQAAMKAFEASLNPAVEMGRRGGSVSTPKKAASSRENGKLGGRPCKNVSVCTVE